MKWLSRKLLISSLLPFSKSCVSSSSFCFSCSSLIFCTRGLRAERSVFFFMFRSSSSSRRGSELMDSSHELYSSSFFLRWACRDFLLKISSTDRILVSITGWDVWKALWVCANVLWMTLTVLESVTFSSWRRELAISTQVLSL